MVRNLFFYCFFQLGYKNHMFYADIFKPYISSHFAHICPIALSSSSSSSFFCYLVLPLFYPLGSVSFSFYFHVIEIHLFLNLDFCMRRKRYIYLVDGQQIQLRPNRYKGHMLNARKQSSYRALSRRWQMRARGRYRSGCPQKQKHFPCLYLLCFSHHYRHTSNAKNLTFTKFSTVITTQVTASRPSSMAFL